MASGAHASRAALAGWLFLFAAVLASVAPTHARPSHLLSRAGHHNQHRRLHQGLTQPCAITGPSAGPEWLNATVTCLEFHPAPSAPIRVPDDTSSTKWGQLMMVSTNPLSIEFLDRQGNSYPVLGSAHPPQDFLVYMRTTPLLIVKAQLSDGGNVISFSVEILVPYSTIMAILRDTQFEGMLSNSEPRPAGISKLVWIRWTFGRVINITNSISKYGTLLQGTFDNLFHAVKDSKGQCQPALCDDPTFQSATCQYYAQFFGVTQDTMTLNWDPNMHTAADTELVPMFPAFSRQYMSRFLQLYELLKPHTFVPQQYVFIAHGNPMGIPQNFTGTLRKATTPVKHC